VAVEYGARVVVLHPGQTSASPEIEERLKQLFAQGAINNSEAEALRAQLARERAHQHREHMDALRHSLDELVVYASAHNIQLGLENRPTYEIANFAGWAKYCRGTPVLLSVIGTIPDMPKSKRTWDSRRT
jgi:sugar phosphate isomerase/epimerase